MKSIDLNKIKDKIIKFISTKEALKDIEPIQWNEDVLSGKKKITVYNSNTKEEEVYYNKNKETFERCKCPCCEDLIRLEGFTDQLSFKEFAISGLCQDYQNDLFKE